MLQQLSNQTMCMERASWKYERDPASSFIMRICSSPDLQDCSLDRQAILLHDQIQTWFGLVATGQRCKDSSGPVDVCA